LYIGVSLEEMLNAGLTGGIASGKTTISRILVDKGAYLIDHDLLAHEAEEPNGPSWRGIVDYFGTSVLTDRRIDRKKLGEIVFNKPEEMLRLNSIVHPAVNDLWKSRIRQIEEKDPRAIIISDVPLLFEIGWQNQVDVVILVYIPPEEQVRRLIARNGISVEEAKARLKSQMPIGDKIKMADFVINNHEPIEAARRHIEDLWEELLVRERLKFFQN
jgi:dephospho-CoA kinase